MSREWAARFWECKHALAYRMLGERAVVLCAFCGAQMDARYHHRVRESDGLDADTAFARIVRWMAWVTAKVTQ